MAYDQRIEELEVRLATMQPSGLSRERQMAFEEQKQRLSKQLAKLRHDRAESWGQQDWLAMIENSLDLLGAKVARWMSPPTRH